MIRGHRGGLFQLFGGGVVRIILASASSSGVKLRVNPLWKTTVKVEEERGLLSVDIYLLSE